MRVGPLACVRVGAWRVRVGARRVRVGARVCLWGVARACRGVHVRVGACMRTSENLKIMNMTEI